MFRRISDLKNYVLEARDGDLGRCKDFLFYDRSWTIRYMVADTRKWLPGRKVLISPISLGTPEWERSRFPVKLTQQQVQESPRLEEDQPVSQHYEQRLLSYYRYPYYWAGPLAWGYQAMPPPVESPVKREVSRQPEEAKIPERAAHLRSAHEVKGYHLQAQDDDIGHVEDFLVDDQTWRIHYLIVDTSNWLPGRKVLVATDWFQGVNWPQREVYVELTRREVEESPEYRSGRINRGYEEELFGHYGARPYWRGRSEEEVLKKGITRLPPD
jgi:hypothetical protein